MKDVKDRFVRWYRLTHWNYEDSWLDFDGDRFTNAPTQAMYVAYRAGFNRANKEAKSK